MDLGLAGKRALVVGATGDVGMAVARALASEGCSLDLAARDEAELEGLAAVLRERFEVEVVLHPADLRQRVETDVLSLNCEEVDILAVCPGVLPGADAGDSMGKGWDFKVFGVGDTIREMASTMAERQAPGTIVVVGTGLPLADAALATLIEDLAGRHADRGVRLAMIDPGDAAAAGRELADSVVFLSSSRCPQRGYCLFRLGSEADG